MNPSASYLLAFDTANEIIAIALGRLDADTCSIELVAHREIAAHRASNTQLIPRIDELMSEMGVTRADLRCIGCGCGPGSFTGVRIALATAKGIAQALGLSLVGASSIDAVAWENYAQGLRGSLLVVADAMRHEVYPVRYELDESGARRLEADRVIKAEDFAHELLHEVHSYTIAGDGLAKYRELYAPYGTIAPESQWTPTGRGIALSLQDAWRQGLIDPFDRFRHDPGLLLPVYTRLSDAEENERKRLSRTDAKNLTTGVQGESKVADDGSSSRATMHNAAVLKGAPDEQGVIYQPMDASSVDQVEAIEQAVMGSDRWSSSSFIDELPRKDRTWWVALVEDSDTVDSTASNVKSEGLEPPSESTETSGSFNQGDKSYIDVHFPSESRGAASRYDAPLKVVGYAGGWVVDGELQILKVGVDHAWRRRGIAKNLLIRVGDDGRNLGANRCTLEVRSGNEGAQAFYRSMGFRSLGKRPRYYSDREDALIMERSLPLSQHDVAGMELHGFSETAVASAPHPYILAIESSCDETAAAIVDGEGNLRADVVASQVDFHARFGGVVPEIASRKHIEAICGVCGECIDKAAASLKDPQFNWNKLDAIAVTYAPGLVGALVVGVAFAKGAAWALDVPFIGVNHLEGHLYANKLADPDFAPPAVVSLVSGGNTMLVYMANWGTYKTLGATIDDAVGEAFDKVAKALGLGYPGGPIISKLAAQGDPDAIPFPRAMLHSGDLRFSLSGLKTAVVNHINQERNASRELNIPDIAASFQQAVIDVQVAKAETALDETQAPLLCVGGGVAANPALRKAYEAMCERKGVKLIVPPISACGDNAAMIALVALDRYREQKFFPLDTDAYAHTNLDEPY